MLYGTTVVLALIGPRARPCAAQVRKLGGEFALNTFTPGSQYRPLVAPLGSDRFITIWEGGGPIQEELAGIRGQLRERSGIPIGTEFLLTTEATADSRAELNPAIAVAPDGSFVVSWASYYSHYSSRIYAKRFDSSGSPLGTQTRVDTRSGGQYNLSVASDAAGNFVVVWDDGGAGDTFKAQVVLRQFSANMEPRGPEFNVTPDGTYARFAEGDAWASGQFVVAWDQAEPNGGGFGVFAQRYDSAGARVGSEIRMNTYTTSGQLMPDVVARADGSFVVVWESYGQDGDGFGIFGRMFSANGVGIGTEFPINSYVTQQQAVPRVAADAAGDFVVIWDSYSVSPDDSEGQDGSGRGIFGQWFGSTGQPRGSEFQVNTYTEGDQGRSPAIETDVASFADGDFVAVWFSPNQDGDRGGVFGQRFATDVNLGPLCGDASGEDLVILASDALAILRAAVGLRECVACVCDVDSSGSISATDGLLSLQSALGMNTLLSCPPCDALPERVN